MNTSFQEETLNNFNKNKHLCNVTGFSRKPVKNTEVKLLIDKSTSITEKQFEFLTDIKNSSCEMEDKCQNILSASSVLCNIDTNKSVKEAAEMKRCENKNNQLLSKEQCKSVKSENISTNLGLKESFTQLKDNKLITDKSIIKTLESNSSAVRIEDSFSCVSSKIDSNMVTFEKTECKPTSVAENEILITSNNQSMFDESSYIEDILEEKISEDVSKAISGLKSFMSDPEFEPEERKSLTSITETCPITSFPRESLLVNELDSNSEKKLCDEIENKTSLSEKDDLSLGEFKESFNQNLSGRESRIKLKSVESNRAVFRLDWGPWIYKCSVMLSIEQNEPDQSRISFEQEENEDDWLVNLGYKAFHYLVKEKAISHPLCNKKTILKLSEYSAIVYKVEILMQDLFKVSVSFAFTISDNMDDLEIDFNMANDARESSYRLICPIDLYSYPDKKIVPKLKHLYLNDITEEVKNAISLVEPGRSYIWNIGKAAENV